MQSRVQRRQSLDPGLLISLAPAASRPRIQLPHVRHGLGDTLLVPDLKPQKGGSQRALPGLAAMEAWGPASGLQGVLGRCS